MAIYVYFGWIIGWRVPPSRPVVSWIPRRLGYSGQSITTRRQKSGGILENYITIWVSQRWQTSSGYPWSRVPWIHGVGPLPPLDNSRWHQRTNCWILRKETMMTRAGPGCGNLKDPPPWSCGCSSMAVCRVTVLKCKEFDENCYRHRAVRNFRGYLKLVNELHSTYQFGWRGLPDISIGNIFFGSVFLMLYRHSTWPGCYFFC